MTFQLGMTFSAALILILIFIIFIPQFIAGDHKELNTYILILLICLFVIIGVVIVVFLNFQNRQAMIQRNKSEFGIYTLQRNRIRRGENKPTNQIELQVMRFIQLLTLISKVVV